MEKENWSRITKVKKRDGRIVEFALDKITNAIMNSASAVGGTNKLEAEKLAEKILTILEYKYDIHEIPTIKEIQDIVERVLIKSGHAKTAKSYIL